MTNGIKYWWLVVMALCCGLWAACKQERQECLAVTTASLSMRCLHKQTDTSTTFVDTALPTARLIAFTNSGADTIEYRTQQSIFALSLSSIADSCRWGFTTDTTGTAAIDTMTFYYTRNQKFVSNACGYTYFYTLTGVKATNVMIDSVQVINNSVTNDVSKRHVQVFIHPSF